MLITNLVEIMSYIRGRSFAVVGPLPHSTELGGREAVVLNQHYPNSSAIRISGNTADHPLGAKFLVINNRGRQDRWEMLERKARAYEETEGCSLVVVNYRATKEYGLPLTGLWAAQFLLDCRAGQVHLCGMNLYGGNIPDPAHPLIGQIHYARKLLKDPRVSMDYGLHKAVTDLG